MGIRSNVSGSTLGNADAIDDLYRQLAELKRRCCCKDFALTTLSPPTGNPGNGAKVLFNPTTGTQYYWNGTAWV